MDSATDSETRGPQRVARRSIGRIVDLRQSQVHIAQGQRGSSFWSAALHHTEKHRREVPCDALKAINAINKWEDLLTNVHKNMHSIHICDILQTWFSFPTVQHLESETSHFFGKSKFIKLSGQKHRGVYDQCRTWPAAQRYPSCRAGSFHFNSRCLEFLEFEGQFVKEIVFERIGSDKKQNICFPQLRPGLALGATEAVVWYRFPKQTG